MTSMESWEARLAHYRSAVSPGLKGWLSDQVFEALMVVGRLQVAAGIAGAVYEIGVYAGRFLLALDRLRRPDEALVAIDIFELPVATEGPRADGAERLLGNVARHGSDPAALRLIKADSATLAVEAVRQAHGPARLFSVDGDHGPARVLGDLRLAAGLLAPGGVVFLDDAFNPHFPGVQEGLARFMLAGAPALVPVAHFGNKLLLTDPAHHRRYLEALTGQVALLQLRRRAQGAAPLPARQATCWDWPLVALRSDDW